MQASTTYETLGERPWWGGALPLLAIAFGSPRRPWRCVNDLEGDAEGDDQVRNVERRPWTRSDSSGRGGFRSRT